jgi:mitochondrial intermembrane space import and assembly protein 40
MHSKFADVLYSPVFSPSEGPVLESAPQTIESIATEKKRRQSISQKKDIKLPQETVKSEEKPAASTDEKASVTKTAADPAQLEEEAGQQGAFNPETGEINWDCPCLGGMAHGPCGEEFKAAFSCFVFSQEDPKGMDCIDKFKYEA